MSLLDDKTYLKQRGSKGGSVRSERKKAAAKDRSQENPMPAGPGRPPRPLEEIECTCGKGDKMPPAQHPANCLRGRAAYRRLPKDPTRTMRPLEEIECTCGKKELAAHLHPWTCTRGRIARRRKKNAD